MNFIVFIASIILDTSASWLRMFAALFLSILVSLIIGISAGVSRKVEKVILPIVDILQTLPILAFFPFAIYVFVFLLPGYIGINTAVVFLIVTSMVWNIIFGVYESIKMLPKEFMELANLYGLSLWSKVRRILIPAAMPRAIEQSVLSWSIGLFYLVTSEIFSIGNSRYAVKYGIGVALSQLAFSGNYLYYFVGLVVFILFVIATRFLFFKPLEKHFKRYNTISEEPEKHSTLRTGIKKLLKYLSRFKQAPQINLKRKQKKKNRKKIHQKIKKINKQYARVIGLWKGVFAFVIIVVAFFIFYIAVYYPVLLKYEYVAVASLIASFARVWLTFIVIMVVAVPICVYLVFISKRRDHYLMLFQIIASIPATILLPIIVMMLKGYAFHSELIAFVIFFLSGIWYIIFSVMASSSSISHKVFELKKLFGIKGLNAWKYIYIKSLLPGLITGSMTAIAAEWNASIVAEYFTTSGISGTNVVSSVSIGIGKLLDISLNSGNIPLMIIALVNLTIMIILVNTFVWKKLYRKVSNIYK